MPRVATTREEFAPSGKFVLARASAAACGGAKRTIGNRILPAAARAICSRTFSHSGRRRDGGHMDGRLRRMKFLL